MVEEAGGGPWLGAGGSVSAAGGSRTASLQHVYRWMQAVTQAMEGMLVHAACHRNAWHA